MNVFRETQGYRKTWWFWTIGAPVVLVSSWGLQYATASANIPITVLSMFGLLLVLVVASLRLTCQLDDQQISVSFFPFPSICIPWSQVKTAFVRKFERSEFKATGLNGPSKNNYKNGKGYYISAGYGLQLETLDGEKILIGTQKPKSMQEFLQRVYKM